MENTATPRLSVILLTGVGSVAWTTGLSKRGERGKREQGWTNLAKVKGRELDPNFTYWLQGPPLGFGNTSRKLRKRGRGGVWTSFEIFELEVNTAEEDFARFISVSN